MAATGASKVALVGQQAEEQSLIRAEDDFDLMTPFEKKVFLRDRAKEQLLSIARKEEKMRRLKEMSGWISDGQSGLVSLQLKMKGLNSILHPHVVKKSVLEQLNSIFETAQVDPYSPRGEKSDDATSGELLFRYFKTPQRIFSIIRRNKDAFLSEVPKSRLIRLRHSLNRHIRLVGGNIQQEEQQFIEITELEALRIMQQSLKKMVFVPKIRTLNWRLKQDLMRKGVAKFEVLLGRYEDCEKIATCEHHFHRRPLGCPNCKVVYLGTKKGASTKSAKKNASVKVRMVENESSKTDPNHNPEYVKSVNIETGVECLEALDFEMSSLQEALVRQQEVVAAASEELQVFEDSLLAKTVITIQNWFCCFSARRKCRKVEEKRLSSLFYHRIRRLVLFKRETDRQNIFSVDRPAIIGRFSELQAEVEEYLDFKFKRKMRLVEKFARTFVQKLKIVILKKRRKNFFEENVLAQHLRMRAEEAEALKKKRFLADIRFRVGKIEGEKFVCLRFGCDNRCFYSKLRYDCHALIHVKEDAEKNAKWEEVLERKRMKDLESKTALNKIRCSRIAVLSLEQSREEATADSDRGVLETSLVVTSAPVRSLVAIGPSGSSVSHLASTCYLEIVSLRKGYRADSRISLDRSVTRIGTADTCECVVRGPPPLDPPGGQEGVLSRVHCMVYSIIEGSSVRIRIVDNSSAYGTYVLSARGVTRVSKRLSEGCTLHPEDLVCLGVESKRPSPPSTREVSEACLILGVRQG